MYSLRFNPPKYKCNHIYHKTNYPRHPNINGIKGSYLSCYIMRSSEEHVAGWISFFKKIVGTSDMF